MPPRCSAAAAMAASTDACVAHVAHDRHGAVAGLLGGPLEAVLAPGQQRDRGAALAEADRDRAAEPARRADDDGAQAAHLVTTGSVCHPRTVEVRACTALSQSTSQPSGKRCSTSSRAMRPSRRARAAPRQKWMP